MLRHSDLVTGQTPLPFSFDFAAALIFITLTETAISAIKKIKNNLLHARVCYLALKNTCNLELSEEPPTFRRFMSGADFF